MSCSGGVARGPAEELKLAAACQPSRAFHPSQPQRLVCLHLLRVRAVRAGLPISRKGLRAGMLALPEPAEGHSLPSEAVSRHRYAGAHSFTLQLAHPGTRKSGPWRMSSRRVGWSCDSGSTAGACLASAGPAIAGLEVSSVCTRTGRTGTGLGAWATSVSTGQSSTCSGGAWVRSLGPHDACPAALKGTQPFGSWEACSIAPNAAIAPLTTSLLTSTAHPSLAFISNAMHFAL